MMHRLVLAGGLVMLLATSSFARMADGSHCRFNRQCASRNCEGGICRSGKSRGTHPSGAPCMRNSQCESGTCAGPRRATRHCK
jgi:hypothetical protein